MSKPHRNGEAEGDFRFGGGDIVTIINFIDHASFFEFVLVFIIVDKSWHIVHQSIN